MSKAPHVKFETPEDVQRRTLEVVKSVREQNGRIRKGVNETTKAIDRSQAKLVVIAEDVNPPEVVMHLPKLAEEKGIPYIYVAAKEDLGRATGLQVGTSSVAIVEVGGAGDAFQSLLTTVKKILETQAKPAKPEAKPKETGAKEEKVKEEKAKPKEEKAKAEAKKAEKAEKKEKQAKPKKA